MAFGMNDVAGSQIFLTGSAVHLARAPTDGGRGLLRSSAAVSYNVSLCASRKIHRHLLTDSRGWYPHILLIQSHISHVELGSPVANIGTADRADMTLLVALTPLAPDGTRMPAGMTGRVLFAWCIDVGRVDMLDMRLCRLSVTGSEVVPLVCPG